jgi:hypothetical protein
LRGSLLAACPCLKFRRFLNRSSIGRWRRPSSGERDEHCRPVYEQVKTLPDRRAREVLDFVGYLRERGECAEWRDLVKGQSASLALVWDNAEDDIWNDV